MKSPLSSHEWKMLHQVMDQVDEQRRGTRVDVARVREVALATYRDQGIEVDGALLDAALAQEAQMLPKPPPSQLVVDLEQVEKAAQLGELAAERKRWKQELANSTNQFANPVERIRASWEAKEAPFRGHFPACDGQLMRRLNHALAERTMAYRQSRQWCVGMTIAAVLGAGMMLAGTGLGLSGTLSSGWALTVFLVGTAMLGIGGTGAQITRREWMESAMSMMTLVRGRQALENKDYESQELMKALRLTGYLVHGSLRPVSDTHQAVNRAKKQAEYAKTFNKSVGVAWEEWIKPDHPLRLNDLAVMDAYLALAKKHPLRSKNWLSLIAQKTLR